jgi:hypothetical protein
VTPALVRPAAWSVLFLAWLIALLVFFVNGTPLHDFGEAQLKTLVEPEIRKTKAP